jgi:serine protease inhibitor
MIIISPRMLAWILVPTVVLLTGGSTAGGDFEDTFRLASSYNNFGVTLYKLIAAENAGRNVITSPLSISLALAMTRNGAAGETAGEIEQVLGLAGSDREWINGSNAELLEKLDGPTEGVTLDIANSIWCRDGLRFDPLFLERTSGYFGAEARSLDFTSPEAAGIINGWVSEHTGGMIDGIIDEIDPLSILFLINAVYFKGEWQYPFEVEDTSEEDFHLASGEVKRVRMMHKSRMFYYHRGPDYQAVQLPYGGGRMSMFLFLPDSSTSLEQFHDRLTENAFKGWLNGSAFKRRKGSVAVPRFRAEFGTMLGPPLARLGMVKAFDPRKADFSCMVIEGPEEIWISEILHKAVIEVTEKGTEAAAVTSVNVVGATFTPEEPFSMVLDRPFFFAIRDNATGMILFMGSIADPERPERAW